MYRRRRWSRAKLTCPSYVGPRHSKIEVDDVDVVDQSLHANSNGATVGRLDVLATWLVAGHHLQRAETSESLGRFGNGLTLPYAMGVESLAAVVAVLLVEDGVALVACVRGGNRLKT